MTTTITPGLSDRYVEAILNRLPVRQRPDIERELRASIADAIDDRVQTGTPPAEAEIAVLTGLGDPERLAAGYAERPLHLIGPALYLDYVRLLKALLFIVVPSVAVTIFIVQTIQHASLGHAIATMIGAAWTTALHIAFWVTALFVFVERMAAQRRPSLVPAWTPNALPVPPSRRARFGELATLTVVTVLFSTAILVSPAVSTVTDAGGQPVSPLSPWLWDTGLVYVFIGLVGLSLSAAFAKYYRPWNRPLALATVVAEAAPAVLLIWLAAGERLLNPAFATAAGWPAEATHWIHTGLIVVGGISVLRAITGGVGRARRR